MLACTANKHEKVIDCIESNFNHKGLKCIKEVSIGNRRVDLECDGGYIEVKRTCEDLTSKRSHDQICDMKNYADIAHKPLVVHTPSGCYTPMNKQGSKYIEKYHLPQCPPTQGLRCIKSH